MAILLNENTTVLIQGITGREGSARTRFMMAYGTRVVAGVTPGRGGSRVWDVPVYDTVREAWKHHGPIDATVTFVPGRVVKDAVLEAIDAGIKYVFMPVERVPLHDALRMIACAREAAASIIGPGSFGVISPGKSVAGWIGGTEEFAREMFPPGHVGIISRSGGQTTTFSWAIAQAGLGVSTAVHIGSEPVLGTTPAELLPLFEEDDDTHAVALFGEIGTVAEEEAAEVIQEGRFTKPLVAYIAGVGAKSGMRFSHASAIVERGRGSAESKIRALREAGAHVVNRPEELGPTVASLLRRRDR
jgi:succinyl-CoA synthetase alpha subunit